MASNGAQLLLSCLAIGLQFYDVTAWSFTPISATAPVVGSWLEDKTYSFSVICQADTPLVKCQFNMLPLNGHEEYALVDLSQGSKTGVITRKDQINDTLLFDVSYNGTGLENGQCGATFSNDSIMSYHYACRGADAAGEWHDMDIMLSEKYSPLISSSINPRQAVVLPGNDVSIVLKANVSLMRCALRLEAKLNRPMFYFNESQIQALPAHYRYYGASMLEGECGITMVNITEADNGRIMFFGLTELTKGLEVAYHVSTVIVAAPPTDTSFKVDKLTYSVGDTLKATCSSLLSRPAANLTWTLDDRIIRQDTINDELQDDQWSWSWDKANITQTISLNITEEHFGKNLECKVQHLALTEIQPQLHYLITKT